MARVQVSAADFVVCGGCQSLRGGPIGNIGSTTIWQWCGCPATREQLAGPTVGDYNMALELCRCCGIEALRSGSRWSVWFCEPCKRRVMTFNDRLGRCCVPIGRHSLMNRIYVGSTADQAADVFAGSFGGLIASIGRTAEWARQAVRMNRVAAGMPLETDIALEAYSTTMTALSKSLKEERWSQLADWFMSPLPETPPAVLSDPAGTGVG